MEYYNSISIKDNDTTRYIFDGKKNSMYGRCQNVFTEAEEYRKVFGQLTENRLRWSEISSEDTERSFDTFVEASPRQLFLNLLMMDFYGAVPTAYGCFERKIGKNRAAKICNEGLKNKLCVKENDPDDRRNTMVFPTIDMVQRYEGKLAKLVFRLARKNNKLGESKIIRLLIDYDKLRQKYLPPEISSQVSFDLMEEFMKDTRNTRGSNNPYLKKKNTPQK